MFLNQFQEGDIIINKETNKNFKNKQLKFINYDSYGEIFYLDDVRTNCEYAFAIHATDDDGFWQHSSQNEMEIKLKEILKTAFTEGFHTAIENISRFDNENLNEFINENFYEWIKNNS